MQIRSALPLIARSLNPVTKIFQLQVCRAIASYIGGDPQDIALTQNTTTGLALLYHGLPLREGDEILTTTHDHYVHHESIRLATGRLRSDLAQDSAFDSTTRFRPDEIAQRIRKAIGPKNARCGRDMGALRQRCAPSSRA